MRKALLALADEGVLQRQDDGYSIRKEWANETKQMIDMLIKDLAEEPKRPRRTESIDEDVTVYLFSSINEMMKFWESIIDDWFQGFEKGDPHINCYQGAHLWEGILHLDRERTLMGQLKRKGIKSYAICTGGTPLDRNAAKFYKEIGLHVHITSSNATFDRAHYIATYGDIIVETTYPEKIVKKLDAFFRKNRTVEHLDLKALSEIVNLKAPVKLTVIKNRSMANHVNKSIIDQC